MEHGDAIEDLSDRFDETLRMDEEALEDFIQEVFRFEINSLTSPAGLSALVGRMGEESNIKDIEQKIEKYQDLEGMEAFIYYIKEAKGVPSEEKIQERIRILEKRKEIRRSARKRKKTEELMEEI